MPTKKKRKMKTEQKVFKGKIKGVGFLYDNPNDYFEKTGYELRFKSGSIGIETKQASLFISAGDIVHFTIKNVDGKMWIDEIVAVKKPPMQKVTFKQRQQQRLFEAAM
jgi:hypothetical protein